MGKAISDHDAILRYPCRTLCIKDFFLSWHSALALKPQSLRKGESKRFRRLVTAHSQAHLVALLQVCRNGQFTSHVIMHVEGEPSHLMIYLPTTKAPPHESHIILLMNNRPHTTLYTMLGQLRVSCLCPLNNIETFLIIEDPFYLLFKAILTIETSHDHYTPF